MPDDPLGMVRVTVEHGLDLQTSGPLFVATARHAADAALAVAHFALASPIATRFCPAETARFTATGEGQIRDCLGFRLDGPGVRTEGVVCAARPPAAVALACLLDGLMPAEAKTGIEPRLAAFLATSRPADAGRCGPASAPPPPVPFLHAVEAAPMLPSASRARRVRAGLVGPESLRRPRRAAAA